LSRAPGAIFHRLRGAVSGFAAGDDAYVDDAVTVRDGAVSETHGFEAGLGAWTASGGWAARTRTGAVEGLGIATNRSILWGFGLEGVQDADTRRRLLGDALARLRPAADDPLTRRRRRPRPRPRRRRWSSSRRRRSWLSVARSASTAAAAPRCACAVPQ